MLRKKSNTPQQSNQTLGMKLICESDDYPRKFYALPDGHIVMIEESGNNKSAQKEYEISYVTTYHYDHKRKILIYPDVQHLDYLDWGDIIEVNTVSSWDEVKLAIEEYRQKHSPTTL